MSTKMCFATTFVVAMLILTGHSVASAQGPGKPIEAPRDQALEIASKHNLDVARFSVTKRKAYEGARDRLQEILDTYPDFSRMDEVVFLMGEVHFRLKKPEKAAEYFSKLLKEYPESEFSKRAQARMDELKGESAKK